MEDKRVINGTFGEVWLDGDKVGECYGCQAKADLKKEAVNICGKMSEGQKVIGWSGKGSLKLHKVNSRMAIKLRPLFKEGKDVRFTIISKLADPDSYGAERVAIKDVSFDDLTLVDFEAAKYGQIDAPFTFGDYDFLDEITTNPI